MSKPRKNSKSKQDATTEEIVDSAQPGGKLQADTVEIAGLEDQIKALGEENDRLRDQMLRARAEFENFKRRRNQEMEQYATLANEVLISDLIPVLDDFDLMLVNGEKGGEVSSLLEGARMIRQKLFNALTKRGLEMIQAAGQPFDPDLHEALLQMPAPGVDVGTVLEVHQTGYRLAGKLLRPSRVIVASNPDGEN